MATPARLVTVDVTFPLVLKMYYHVPISCDAGSITLTDFKTQTFSKFWDQIGKTQPHVPKHGNIKAVALYDSEGLVANNQSLRNRLASGSRNFFVVFRHDHKK